MKKIYKEVLHRDKLIGRNGAMYKREIIKSEPQGKLTVLLLIKRVKRVKKNNSHILVKIRLTMHSQILK